MSKFINKVVTGVSTLALAASMLVMPFATTSVHAAMAGEVYKTTDGTVWFITDGMQKRPFTSAGAFLSYGFLSFSQVKEADATVTALPTGSFIAPQDGRIFCATETKASDVKGECSLITGGKKAAFTSSAVFTGQGYSFARAYYGDSSFLEKTSNVDNASAQHRPGTLINNNGTIQLVVTGGLWGTPSMDVFNSWGWNIADVVPANSADVLLSQTGVISARTAGQLSPSATTAPEDNGPLEGGVGSITVTSSSTYSAEDVGEDESDIGVMAFEVEAGDDSDVQINSIKVELKQTVTTNSQDIADYIDEVTVWQDGDQVGDADPSDFSENSDIYTKSISLDNAIVRSGETSVFHIAVSALSQLDSGDIDNDAFGVDVLNVRFVDGDGVTTTEDTDADTLDQTFDFDGFATTADVELAVELNEADSAINDAHVIDVDDSTDTNDEEILSFTLEAAGDSDITVNDIPVLLTVTGAANVDDMITGVALWYDGDEVDTAAVGSGVGTTETYTFADLDIEIAAGETAEFKVAVDLKSTADVDLDNGDTIMADLTGTEVDAIDADDEVGDNVSTTNLTGTANGEAHAVYDAGIMSTFVSADAERTFTADATGEDDQGTFTLVFDVTAFDGDMYIDKSVADQDTIGDAGEGIEYNVTATGGAVPTESSALLEAEGVVTGDNANVFKVLEGSTRTFTLTVVLTADTTPDDGSAQVIMESINWGTATDDTNDNNYIFDLGDYKTPYLFLNGIA